MIKLLPKIRASIAIKLYFFGLSQNEIAKLLEVSQAEVSNYIRFKRGKFLNLEVIDKIALEMYVNKKALSDVLCKYCSAILKSIGIWK